MGADTIRVAVYGDINVDVLAPLDAPLIPGGDNLPDALELQLGGVAANTAVGLAKWGAQARLVGCVGQDWFGDFALQKLEACGVDVSAVSRVAQPTGLIFIPIDPGGRRTIIGSRGANAVAPDSSGIETWLCGVRWLHTAGYSLQSPGTARFTSRLLELGRKNEIRVSLDAGLAPSQKLGDQIRRLAPQLDVLFLGQEEGEALTGRSGAAALEAAGRLGAREVIIKAGADGCQYMEKGNWRRVAPFSVAAVDSTGAGDAFAAGFILARLHGWPTADAVLFANAMGAAAACTVGAGAAMPGPGDVQRILEYTAADGSAIMSADRLRGLLLLGEERRGAAKVSGGRNE